MNPFSYTVSLSIIIFALNSQLVLNGFYKIIVKLFKRAELVTNNSDCFVKSVQH